MSPYDLFTKEEINNMLTNEKLEDAQNKKIKKELKEMVNDDFDFKKMVKQLGKDQIDSHEKRINKKAKDDARFLGNLKDEITSQVADILKDKDE